MAGELLATLFSYQTVDMQGWWPLALYVVTGYGVIYACIFATIARLLDNHKKYTTVFSGLIVLYISLLNLLSYLYPHSIFSQDKFFYGGTALALAVHFLLCVSFSKSVVKTP